jgi:DNA-binding NarL/FixJ family response regulator
MNSTIMPYKIIIADNQFLTTKSLKMILQEENQYVVNQVVTNKKDLLNALKTAIFEVLIVDYSQIDFDHVSDLQKIRKEYPCLSILILTNTIIKSDLMELNNIGIHNIILKTADQEEILAALDATVKSKKYYSETILEILFEFQERKKTSENIDEQLTCSEIGIVRLIADGYTTKEIATRKNISFHTVMSHRKNIFRKLGVNNISELLMHSVKSGLIGTIEYHI